MPAIVVLVGPALALVMHCAHGAGGPAHAGSNRLGQSAPAVGAGAGGQAEGDDGQKAGKQNAVHESSPIWYNHTPSALFLPERPGELALAGGGPARFLHGRPGISRTGAGRNPPTWLSGIRRAKRYSSRASREFSGGRPGHRRPGTAELPSTCGGPAGLRVQPIHRRKSRGRPRTRQTRRPGPTDGAHENERGFALAIRAAVRVIEDRQFLTVRSVLAKPGKRKTKRRWPSSDSRVKAQRRSARAARATIGALPASATGAKSASQASAAASSSKVFLCP